MEKHRQEYWAKKKEVPAPKKASARAPSEWMLRLHDERPALWFFLFRKRNWKLIGVAFVLLVSAAIFGPRPAQKYYSTYRAQKFSAEALALLAKGDIPAATTRAAEAKRLRPDEPAVARAQALILLREGRSDEALKAWDAFLALGGRPDDSDRFARASAFLDAERPAAAAALLDATEVSDVSRAIPERLLRARIAGALGPAESVPPIVLAVLESELATPAERLEAVRLALAEDSSRAGIEEAVSNELVRLARSNTPTARDALLLAVSSQRVSKPFERGEVARLLRLLKGDLEERLAILDAEILETPGRKAALVADADQSKIWGGSETDLARLADWLNRHGAPTRTLELVTRTRALARPELALARVEALMALGRLHDAEIEIKGPRYPLEQILQQMLLARILAAGGDLAGSRQRWELALALASDRPRLRLLERQALAAGATDIVAAARGGLAHLSERRP